MKTKTLIRFGEKKKRKFLFAEWNEHICLVKTHIRNIYCRLLLRFLLVQIWYIIQYIEDSLEMEATFVYRCIKCSDNVCSSSETLSADFTRLTALFGLSGFPGDTFFIFILCLHLKHVHSTRCRRCNRTHVWLILWRELSFSPSIHENIRVIFIHGPYENCDNE